VAVPLSVEARSRGCGVLLAVVRVRGRLVWLSETQCRWQDQDRWYARNRSHIRSSYHRILNTHQLTLHRYAPVDEEAETWMTDNYAYDVCLRLQSWQTPAAPFYCVGGTAFEAGVTFMVVVSPTFMRQNFSAFNIFTLGKVLASGPQHSARAIHPDALKRAGQCWGALFRLFTSITRY